MFKRKKENKAKLEHKLYLARETPESIFDLSECELRNVPQGIYSLCKVFLKETLRLDSNCLSSLSGGGQLSDLHLLKVLNLQYNAFVHLPDDIHLLKNLQELYISNNRLRELPQSICDLIKLENVDLSYNFLKELPENLGKLQNLRKLNLCANKDLCVLPKSIVQIRSLKNLQVDGENFTYPPKTVVICGIEAIIRFICDDLGLSFIPEPEKEAKEEVCDNPDKFQTKIMELEQIKKQKLQEFLELEKTNELLQKQELELANAQKLNRQKLLEDITKQQTKIDKELTKIHKAKEFDRFRLIEQLQEVEENSDKAIQQLLNLNSKSTQIQQLLMEREKLEEERLLSAAATKYNTEKLRKADILANMQGILQQEKDTFQVLQENRLENSRSILEQEMVVDENLSRILQDQDLQKAELVGKLQQNADLQKAAVGTLLERGDDRSWGLIQQVRLVESQLAALTNLEIDKKKLEIDQHVNDLAEKRVNLSILLMDLLEQQQDRRMQLLDTLRELERNSRVSGEDFWLRQYQALLDKLPTGLSEAQKNMDPDLAQALLMNGVISCLPFLAKLTQKQYDLDNVTENDLSEAGIRNRMDRIQILEAFQMYKKQEKEATAPAVEEASAPPIEETKGMSECVVCLDKECDVVFVPCGHVCCCIKCATVENCPLCRSFIERKIQLRW